MGNAPNRYSSWLRANKKQDDAKLSHIPYYPLTAIRVFRETVKEGSFTKAALRLNVTQSAVSQRIKFLETHLGCCLFMRQRQNVVLTEEGKFLYEKSDRALNIMEHAVSSIVSGNISQRIVLGVLSSFTSKWLIPRLHRFYQEYPNMQLVTRSVNHTIDIERENAEIAVVNLPSPPSSQALRSSELWRDNLFAVCSPDYLEHATKPLKKPADLANHVLLHDQTEIASNRHLDWKSWLRAAAPGFRIDLDRGRFFTQNDLTLQAAIEGHGIALARSSLVSDDIKKGMLIDPLGVSVVAKSACYICSLKHAWDIPKIKMVRKWLQDEAENDHRMFTHISTSNA